MAFSMTKHCDAKPCSVSPRRLIVLSARVRAMGQHEDAHCGDVLDGRKQTIICGRRPSHSLVMT